MVNNPLKKVEGNIEICCSEMTENPLKNFQHLLTLVHLMFPYQYLINNPNFQSFLGFGKTGMYSLDYCSKIPIFHFFS